MNRKGYQKVKEIFHSALDYPADKRSEFLDEVCRDDKNLRDEVKKLLDSYKSGFLEQPAVAEVVEEFVAKSYLEIGQEFSHYRIISKIGEGGMGEVYLAEDKRLERTVAIKFLSREFSEDEERLSRFVQEAKAASALNHPNIITVFEIREHDDKHFIVSEYIDGRTLGRRIERKNLSVLSAIDIAIQITSALVAAHEAGIIHRDIKPDNVMIRKDGIVKILDFGLAKPTVQNSGAEIDKEAETRAKVMTMPGVILGTPQYMSPEQARGRNVDARTDIFSLGVVFYEMITGKPPFVGENQLDLVGSILKDTPPPLGKYVEDIPHELEHIVDKTLRKDPEQRYQHIKDLLIDLKDLKDDLKFEAKLSHNTDAKRIKTTAQNTSAIVSARRFSFIHAALFMVTVGLIVGAIWWFTTGNNNQTNNLPDSLKINEVTSWSSSPGELFSTGSFSPDARMVAFSSTKTGTKSIWIKQTKSGGEAIQITKDEFDNKFPVWSPDGNEIAFFSTRRNQASRGGNSTGIWRIPALGGTPKSITAVEDGSAQIRAWSKSGKIYYDSKQNLFSSDISSGQVVQVTDFDEKNSNVKWINISPDEKQIAYLTKERDIWKIWLKSLDEDSPKQLLKLEKEIDNLIWHPDGKRILYNTLVNEIFQIFVMNLDEMKPKQITFSERDSFIKDISADGKNILFGSAKEESDVWYVKIADKQESAFVSEINSDLWADVSSDNKTIAFQSIKNLSQGDKLLRGAIKIKSKGANEAETQLAENGFSPAWSPNGETLAFLRRLENKPQIWIINKTGGEAKALATDGVQTSGYNLSPYNRTQNNDFSWSPTGDSIAYISNKSGQPNIWLVSSDGLSNGQLSDINGEKLMLYSPIWSSDGKSIAFSSKARKPGLEGKAINSLWIVDAKTKETKKVFETTERIRLIGWSENEKQLIFAESSKSDSLPPEVDLYEVSIETGQKNLLKTLKDTYYNNIRLSPDRKTIAFASHRDKKDDIWVVSASGGEDAKKLTNNNDPRLYFSSLSWSPDGNAIFFGKQSRFSLLLMLDNFE